MPITTPGARRTRIQSFTPGCCATSADDAPAVLSGSLHALRDDVVFREFADLAVELKLVTDDLALVFDAQLAVLDLGDFHKRHFVLRDLPFRELELALPVLPIVGRL